MYFVTDIDEPLSETVEFPTAQQVLAFMAHLKTSHTRLHVSNGKGWKLDLLTLKARAELEDLRHPADPRRAGGREGEPVA